MIYKIGSGKLKLALVCVRELQKLAIVAWSHYLSELCQSRERSREHCCLTLLDPVLTEGMTGVVKTQFAEMPWTPIRALLVWTPDHSRSTPKSCEVGLGNWCCMAKIVGIDLSYDSTMYCLLIYLLFPVVYFRSTFHSAFLRSSFHSHPVHTVLVCH